ncbi:hypothetical protein ROZALSC1DRAFT_27496, partial [Rozella allomycis CSF55]
RDGKIERGPKIPTEITKVYQILCAAFFDIGITVTKLVELIEANLNVFKGVGLKDKDDIVNFLIECRLVKDRNGVLNSSIFHGTIKDPIAKRIDDSDLELVLLRFRKVLIRHMEFHIDATIRVEKLFGILSNLIDDGIIPAYSRNLFVETLEQKGFIKSRGGKLISLTESFLSNMANTTSQNSLDGEEQKAGENVAKKKTNFKSIKENQVAPKTKAESNCNVVVKDVIDDVPVKNILDDVSIKKILATLKFMKFFHKKTSFTFDEVKKRYLKMFSGSENDANSKFDMAARQKIITVVDNKIIV